MKKTILLLTGLVALNFQNQAQTVQDADGNVYDTIRIGTQVWLKENLRTTKYNDGTTIPLTDDSIGGSLTTPAYCNINNTINADTINTYGRLYNWYTVNTNKLCPTDWHVPTDTEWFTLTDLFGGYSSAGAHLKEAGTTHWKSPNNNDNSSGFNALPTSNNGEYWGTSFWSTGLIGGGPANYAWSFLMVDFMDVAQRNPANMSANISVRCLLGNITGIHERNYNNELKIFPNPTSDKINIDCTEKENNLYIYNLIGGLVFQKRLDYGINKMDISYFQQGIYIIKIETEHGTTQQKLIKK